MRKVTEQIAQAFKAGKHKTVGNTMTDGTRVYLHGNLIAERLGPNTLMLTLAGWNTPTTRERVNGICQVFGLAVGFSQRNFEPVLQIGSDESVIDSCEPIYFGVRS